MKAPKPERPRLRKREVLFAVAMGAVAAGGAAVILSESSDNERVIVEVQGPSDLSNLAPFDKIATVGPQDVVITYGETQSVRADGSAEAIALLEVVSEGGVLRIQPRDGGWMWAWARLNATTYHVTVPRLTSVTLEGTGDVRVDKVEGAVFSGTIEGGPGDLTIEGLKVEQAEFTVNGPGDLTVAGTAGATRLSIDGPGNIRGSGLRSQTASVTVNGPGDARLTVDRQANVELNGPGDVEIDGSARCTVSRNGPGDVDCEGGIN